MYQVNNLTDNKNINELDSKGCFHVIEHNSDLSVSPAQAQHIYFAQQMGIKRRQVLIELNNNSVTVQSGAMQWMLGNITSGTGVKGIGDFIGKALSAKVTKESTIKPEYSGNGLMMLEPTYKHIILVDVSKWGSIVLEDGLFLACESSLSLNTVMRSTLSSAVAGNEGLFNLCLTGNGIAALESPVAENELFEFELQDDVLKIDGSMAIAWSNSLKFTVERSSKTLLGSAVNGEGLVNVYRGTGKVLMTPTSWSTSNGIL